MLQFEGVGFGNGGQSSLATINFFRSPDWNLDITKTQLNTGLTLGNMVFVFRNGVGPLSPINNYTISGNTITFVTPLEDTDEIAVINNNLSGIDLTPYSLKPTVVTNGDNTGLVIQANKIYKFATALTTLTLTSAEVSDYESVIYFTTGNTITFTDNSGLKWGGDGSAPSLEINTIYCISIRNGLAEIDTFGTMGA